MKMLASTLYSCLALLTGWRAVVAGSIPEPDDDYGDYQRDGDRCINMLVPSYERLEDFDFLCQNLDIVIECSAHEIDWKSTEDSNQFATLFDLTSMEVAYNGICYDLMTVEGLKESMKACLMSHKEKLEACLVYYDEPQAAEDIIGDCSVLKDSSDCEATVLSDCDETVSKSMRSFYTAALSTACKKTLHVVSPYDTWYAEKTSVNSENSVCRKTFMEIPRWATQCFGPIDAVNTSVPLVVSWFDRVCSDYDGFLSCAADLIKNITPTSFFDLHSQRHAYRDFCPKLPELRRDMTCVGNSSNDYTCDLQQQQLFKKIEKDDGQQKISLCKYISGCVECEINLFRSCSEQVASALKQFYLTAMPRFCHNLAEVSALNERPAKHRNNNSLAHWNVTHKVNISKLRSRATKDYNHRRYISLAISVLLLFVVTV